MYKLAPSILAADFTKLGDQILKIENAGADYLHIDVMDGEFVPSISFGMPLISSIRKITELPFDVHLMIQKPERYIKEFADIGADIITVQVEACTHLNRTISMIKECGKKAGVSLNPSTPLSVLDYILEEVDMVLIMSVNPGYGGQEFIQSSLKKIKNARDIINMTGKNIDIQVDGGVSLNNTRELMSMGANVLVAGTSVFSGDIASNVKQFKEIFTCIDSSALLG